MADGEKRWVSAMSEAADVLATAAYVNLEIHNLDQTHTNALMLLTMAQASVIAGLATSDESAEVGCDIAEKHLREGVRLLLKQRAEQESAPTPTHSGGRA